jgi:hypothetical protein
MRMPSSGNLLTRPRILGALLGLALAGSPALGRADSGVGIDTNLANKIDPTAGHSMGVTDLDGTSWLEPGQHSSPTGNLYQVPPVEPDVEALGLWLVYGSLDVGYLHTSGQKTALFDRYTSWPAHGPAASFDVNAERPSDGSYAELKGSFVSAEDQYYEAVYGKAGAYKAQVFVSDLSNILSTDAKPIFNGVGSNNLTLAGGLVPGGSTPAEVAAASAAAPVTTLGTRRDKQGIALSAFLTPDWSVYFNISDEERKGDRPYGGPFFFNLGGIGGGIEETVKPINDSTVNLSAGARYVGAAWRLDFGYTGSLYRDDYLSYSFQQPFDLGPPVIPGAASARITQGQMSMEPDNAYHDLHVTATHVLPLDGEASLNAEVGEMRQNSSILPPTNCQGVFGISTNGTFTLGPGNPLLFPCSQWNTSAALSQQTANMLIVTKQAAATIVLKPASDVTFRAGTKYNDQDYRNQYVMYNPENGSYGYVAENGAEASIIPGDPGFWNPITNPHATDTQIESIPYSWQTLEAYGGVDWRISRHNTLGLTYTFDHYDPAHREVSYVNDNTLKLNWTNRSIGWLTLRANYTYLNQSGSVYNDDPYAFAFFQNLPGFVPSDDTVTAWTVNGMRKYDIADREESKIDLMATFLLRPDMSVTASLRADWNRYPSAIGREAYDTAAAMLQWEWQLQPQASTRVWVAWDHSGVHLANVNDAAVDTPNDTLGGPTYPLANRWWAQDEERNWSGGASLTRTFGRARVDLGWSYLSSRGITTYSYDTPSALTYPYTAAQAGNQFPAMTYVVNSLTLNVTVPLDKRTSLRFYDYYEHGQIADWHYANFDNTLVYGNRVYVDAGPQGYSANVIGVFLSVKL